jgi:hypothetical protein
VSLGREDVERGERLKKNKRHKSNNDNSKDAEDWTNISVAIIGAMIMVAIWQPPQLFESKQGTSLIWKRQRDGKNRGKRQHGC